ncbi:MAG: aspartate kinase [Candidatus Thorarchaeota archaeon]|jgi:aspartate kinase
MKVLKFGGGCLKNSESILRVVEILQSDKEPKAVVVSALNGVTDQLIDGMTAARESESNVPNLVGQIKDAHVQVIEAIISENILKNSVISELEAKLQRLERLLYGIAYTEEIFDSVRVLILSYGERLSAITVAGLLNSHGIQSIALESDKIGIQTESACDNATAVLSTVRENLEQEVAPLLKQGITPIITGYFGCDEEGRISTFGRNGSDYSAAVVTHGIGAKTLEIWKDVKGFMTANPKLVEHAKQIDHLSYYEAAELSYFGAKILHPRTVEPLINSEVEISIRNINAPDDRPTLILPTGQMKDDVIKSVTYNNEISVLKVQGAGVGYRPGIIGDIGKKLFDSNINIYSVITAQTCINLLIDRNDSDRSVKVLKPLEGGVIERIIVDDDIALVAVVGEGLVRTEGLAAKVFSAVAEREINVEMISAGASEVAYYFTVSQGDMEHAVQAIHSCFFEQ